MGLILRLGLRLIKNFLKKYKIEKKKNIVACGDRVHLFLPTLDSAKDYLILTNKSIDFHHPWIFPAKTIKEYRFYLSRIRKGYTKGFFISRNSDNQLLGVININDIRYGAYYSCTLGYYLDKDFCKKGYMLEGLVLLMNLAFDTLFFNRIEVNIQPENISSKSLVKKCGFQLEGFSPKFLNLDGKWRDHERWAAVKDSWKSIQSLR